MIAAGGVVAGSPALLSEAAASRIFAMGGCFSVGQDVTDRSAHETAESPAATGERGGA
ncbi:hypothetical protein [Streptomyces sp. NPDC101234]|uniref:hypothetical protein n=1 Tax=Streptomyces sp. NPDC101234 TaxID=3366138 RepID=UPI003806F529